MKLKVYSLMIVIIICFSLIGCSQSDKVNKEEIGKQLENVLSTPDKIIIHNQNSVKELSKNNPEFKKIVELTNKRFHDKLTTIKDIINDKSMEDIYKDGVGIEFIYNEEQSLNIKGDGFIPFKYYKLYFQLTSERYGNSQGSMVHTLQYGDKEHYKDCSRGFLIYSEQLVKFINSLKQWDHIG